MVRRRKDSSSEVYVGLIRMVSIIRLVRPSLTFLGHHTLLIWQDWLVFTAVFSVTSIYLENATTPPPIYKISPPDWGP